MGKSRTKKDYKIGDFVLYQFLAKDFVKGRILELGDKEAKIEIGFCNKKSEDVKTEEMDVEYKYLIPIEEYLESKNMQGNILE